MSVRNLSPQVMFEQLALEHVPEQKFTGSSENDFLAWKQKALPQVLATLGDFPEQVPLNPELVVEWEQEGLRKQRWMIDVGKHISATCIVNIPQDLAHDERRPAILCWHGHGPHGKDSVMGNDSSIERRDVIKAHNYDYGRQMAQAGFVTFGIDSIGMGERNDSAKPHFRTHNNGRDWCNLYYLHATMLGMTSLSINIAHGMAATDFVSSLPCVDPQRLGVMGLSGGGTMTLWSALCDERFKAAEIICYSDLWAYFGMRDLNYCGMQVAPGLFKLVDLPDLQGLLAPHPLLVDIGVYDTCFTVDTSLNCFHQVEAIYKAAGAQDLLELDLFTNEHSWGGNKSLKFFRHYLRA
jgi:Abhydrolase family